jgi:hypothetical protein
MSWVLGGSLAPSNDCHLPFSSGSALLKLTLERLNAAVWQVCDGSGLFLLRWTALRRRIGSVMHQDGHNCKPKKKHTLR